MGKVAVGRISAVARKVMKNKRETTQAWQD